MPRHLGDEGVVGVQDRRPAPWHRLHDHLFHCRQLAHGGDAAQAQVVAGHVEHHRYVVALVAEALAQDPAPRDLEDGGVDHRVLKDRGSGARPAHVPAADDAPIHEDPIRRGQPHLAPHPLEDVGDHARGRRLAVAAGDRHDRDA